MDATVNIYTAVKALSNELGFVATGYAPVTSLKGETARYVHAMQCGHFAELGYLKRNIEKRENPALLVEGAKSVLVFLAPYGNHNNSEHIPISFNNSIPNRETPYSHIEPKEYKVAQYALGEDYHTVIKNKLGKIFQYIKECNPMITGRIFVDTAPVLERAWAVRAGLGFIGKNNFLISRENGIRNFIGIIVSNFEIPQERYDECGIVPPEKWDELCNKRYCGSCTKCIDACPTGALCAPYSLDANKCISYLTIESKEASPISNMEQAEKRGGWIFGCDACMNACPWNSRNKPGWSEFNQKEYPLPHTHLKRR